MDNSKTKVTFIELLKIMLKRIRLSTLILLLITSVSTSFAWFIYATKVSAGITTHIETWNILFTNEDNAISEYVNFVIPNLVPGMEDYTASVSAYNLGEHSATISYEIVSVKILGVNYTVDGTTLTSSMLENRLYNDYPFKIQFDLSNEVVTATTGRSTFSINVSWPYESGNDELDTYWGAQSFTYSSNNPGEPSIEMTVKISAIQERG